MSCGWVHDRIEDWLEQSLDADDRARFARHIDGCDGCREDVSEQRLIHDLFRDGVALHVTSQVPSPREVVPLRAARPIRYAGSAFAAAAALLLALLGGPQSPPAWRGIETAPQGGKLQTQIALLREEVDQLRLGVADLKAQTEAVLTRLRQKRGQESG